MKRNKRLILIAAFVFIVWLGISSQSHVTLYANEQTDYNRKHFASTIIKELKAKLPVQIFDKI